MLRVEAPANFILTLHSMPPFFVENIFALTLVVLLTVPLIAHIQLLLKNTGKVTSTMVTTSRCGDKYHCDKLHREYGNRTVVMHYPAPAVKLDSSSNSDVDIQLTSMRTTCSTPTVKRSIGNLKIEIAKENRGNQQGAEHYKQIFREIFLKNQKTCLPLDRSSSFLATNAQLPIIDISAFDYDSYRHKLIGISLKRQYGDRQAPGDVVLNSIHLNCVGSQSGIQLSEKYSHSLFDFIEEYYDVTKAMSKKEKEYLHPLDHFLVKSGEKPKTTNTGTETRESVDRRHLEQVPEIVACRNESLISAAAAPLLSPAPFEKSTVPTAAKDVSKLALRSRRSSSMPRTSSQVSPRAIKPGVITSRNNNRDSSLTPATQQIFRRTNKLDSTEKLYSSTLVVPTDGPKKPKKPFLTSRTSRSRTPPDTTSTPIPRTIKTPETVKIEATLNNESLLPIIVTEKSSSDSINPSATKFIKYRETLSSMDRAVDDKESSVTYPSASSSEAESCCNSSKPREKFFVRSRVSALSSRSRTIRIPTSRTSQVADNVSGNHLGSENRNSKMPSKQSSIEKQATKPKLSVRPKSTVGRFTWDVPDVPVGHTSCDQTILEEKPANVEITQRPLTASSNTSSNNKRRTFEKAKHSDMVLPVLESFDDLRVSLPCDNFDDSTVNIDNQQNHQGNVRKRPSSEAFRESKQTARSRDSRSRVYNESFVKLPMRHTIAVEKSHVLAGQKSSKANSVEEKTSSGIKSSAAHPGYKPRIHSLVATTKTENLIKDINEENSADKTEFYLNKSPRTRRTGHFQARTSPLSSKKEADLEDKFQSTAGKNVIAKVSDVSKQEPLDQGTAIKNEQLQSSSDTSPTTLGIRKHLPVVRSGVNKFTSSPNRLMSKDNTNSTRKSCQ